MASADNISSDIPVHCPGTQSDNAGKASACAGCPNQKICESGDAKGPDSSLALVKEKLSGVQNKLLILSGKGGVGKSTLTALLARTFAHNFPNWNFGVLDIDICGPSQPRVLDALQEQVHQSGSGWSPVYVDDNLSLMSIGFLLNSPDDAIIWRGPKKNGMIRQFLTEVDWGDLDFLLLDTPPGTSDEHLSASTFLNNTDGSWGAVIVTTPQEVALLDVRKEISFCKKMNIPIVGVIENMSGFICPKCTTKSDIFPAKTGGAEKMCLDCEVTFLGSLPLDPLLTKYCDDGKNFITECPDPNRKTIVILNKIINDIIKYFKYVK